MNRAGSLSGHPERIGKKTQSTCLQLWWKQMQRAFWKWSITRDFAHYVYIHIQTAFIL